NSYREIITYCLEKVGYEMDFLDSAFIEPEGGTVAPPLYQTAVKNKAFKGLNCYEVLERIVFANLGRLTQLNGAWQMVPIDQLKGEYELRNGLDSTLVNPIIEIGDVRSGEPIFRDKSQILSIKAA